jgi:hypothetical protein
LPQSRQPQPGRSAIDAPPLVGDRFIFAASVSRVQGDRKIAGRLRAATLVATDRPRAPQQSA